MENKEQQIVDKNYEFYKKNAKDIADKYGKKYIIISDENIIESFDIMQKAYDFGVKKFGLGKFIVQNADYFGSIQYLSRLSFA